MANGDTQRLCSTCGVAWPSSLRILTRSSSASAARTLFWEARAVFSAMRRSLSCAFCSRDRLADSRLEILRDGKKCKPAMQES